jgi:hypothetical protein
MPRLLIFRAAFLVIMATGATPAAAEPQATTQPSAAATSPQPSGARAGDRQAKRESAFAEMLRGATLEGSFTSTAAGGDPAKLSRDKYTLGDVRKVGPNVWLIPARIQYGEHDVTLPITVPIQWAGDTPVIVVDNLGLPRFGTVSARVMFFADHYAGYWEHGEHGGHLFGVVHRAGKKRPAGSADAPADDQQHEQARQQ